MQNIISGKGGTGEKSIIQTAARFLTASKKAGGKVSSNEFTKEQEVAELSPFIEEHQLWYPHILDKEHQIGESAEQKVFLQKNGTTVVK